MAPPGCRPAGRRSVCREAFPSLSTRAEPRSVWPERKFTTPEGAPLTWAVRVARVRGPALSVATVSVVWVGVAFSAAAAPATVPRNNMHQEMVRFPSPTLHSLPTLNRTSFRVTQIADFKTHCIRGQHNALRFCLGDQALSLCINRRIVSEADQPANFGLG